MIIVVVVVKYVGFVLFADDYGEGGTFALYSMLSRHLQDQVRNRRRFLLYNNILAGLAIVGVAAVLADGVLTPAISVLSAVAGIGVAAPGLSQEVIVGVSIAILFLLFMVQRFGTTKVAFLFSPVILVWLIAIVAMGIYYIAQVPSVFAALSPHYAFMFFINNGYQGWVSLGAIVLVVTGCEALYADLGHFSAAAIRISSLCFVVPCLLLAYMGQAAALIINYHDLVAAGWVPGTSDFPPGVTVVISNTFFNIIPASLLIPYVIIATLAAIIASQALISASYSLVTQAMRLSMFPRMTIVHTDEHHYGQIYVPEVNYALMVGTIIVCAVAQNSNALTYAYGVTVTSVFVITTIMYTVAIPVRFKRHYVWAVLFFTFFMIVDVAFLSANLLKFTTGAWFPVVVAIVLSTLMVSWRWGRLRMVQRQSAMSVPDAELFKDGQLVLAALAETERGRHTVLSPYLDGLPPAGAVAHDSGVADGAGTQSETSTALHPSSNATTARRVPGNYASLGDHGRSMSTTSGAVLDMAGGAIMDLDEVVVLANRTFIWYSAVSSSVPAAFVHFVRRMPALPARLVFVTVTVVNVPRIHTDFTLVPVDAPTGHIWRASVTHGYAEAPPNALALAALIARRFELKEAATAPAPSDTAHADPVAAY